LLVEHLEPTQFMTHLKVLVEVVQEVTVLRQVLLEEEREQSLWLPQPF
jgi:hypothetical protein